MNVSRQVSAETGEIQEIPFPFFVREPGVCGWVTRAEAARFIGCCTKTVDRLRKKGFLQDMGLGPPILITQESLESYMGRPVQPLPDDFKMILVPIAQYDSILLKASCVDAVKAKLVKLEREYEELKGKYAELSGEDGDVEKSTFFCGLKKLIMNYK